MEDNRTKVLEELYRVFEEDGKDIDELHCRLLKKGEYELETDILTTLHESFGTMSNTAEGDFFFDGDTFVSRILIASYINPSRIPELCVLISMKNSEIPIGCFEYNPGEDVLAYSLKTPFTGDLTFEEKTDLAGRCISMALSVSEQYCSDLIECARRA